MDISQTGNLISFVLDALLFCLNSSADTAYNSKSLHYS